MKVGKNRAIFNLIRLSVQKFSGNIKVETKSDFFLRFLNEIAKLYKAQNSQLKNFGLREYKANTSA